MKRLLPILKMQLRRILSTLRAIFGLGGCCHGKLGRYQEEIEAYKQAIRIKPDYAEAHCNLGVTYLMLGDQGSASDEYKILKDLDSDLANKLLMVRQKV